MSRTQGTHIMTLVLICYLQSLFLTSSAFHIVLSPSESEVSVQIGDPFSITCEASGCLAPSFLWARLLDKTLSGKTSLEGKRSTLSIASVSEDTEGAYVCKVFCNGQTEQKSFKLNVYSFPADPVLQILPLVAGVESSVICTYPLIHPLERLDTYILFDGKLVVSNDHHQNPVWDNKLQNISLTYNWTPTEKDEGKVIECKGEMSFSEDGATPKIRSTTMSLRLRYPPAVPIITVHPSNIVREGEEISLDCTEKSTEKTLLSSTVLWVKVEGDKETRLQTGESGFLRFQKADIQDAGTYICYTQNDVGNKSAQVEISVQGVPGEPEFSILPMTVTQGKRVIIHCSVLSGSDATVTLWKASDTGDIILRDIEGTLYIEDAAPIDSGVYKCKTKNAFGDREAKELLTVEYAPTNTVISASASSVVEGGSVILTCVSEGIPPPSIFLYKISESGKKLLLSEQSEATLTDVQSVDSGEYECTAHNNLGNSQSSMELHVQVPPKNTNLIITPSGVVKEGDLVFISCTSEASPDPTVVLKKKTNLGIMDLGIDGGEHMIFHAQVGHTGTYVCESKNIVGQQVAEATLIVQVPPRNTTVLVLPSENVTEGDTVIITCETNSIPSPTILLKKVCAGSNTFLQAKNGTFTLHNVTRNDTGTYMLSISNEAGNETEVIEILVKERQVSAQYRLTTPIIVMSLAVISAGVIGFIIYNLKQAQAKGSYNLVNALMSIV